jgi:hypothetical protein
LLKAWAIEARFLIAIDRRGASGAQPFASCACGAIS